MNNNPITTNTNNNIGIVPIKPAWLLFFAAIGQRLTVMLADTDAGSVRWSRKAARYGVTDCLPCNSC